MAYLAERRKYQRCCANHCKVLISTDGVKWDIVEAVNISAGGLKFVSKKTLKENETFFLNLSIYNMFSEFNFSFQGEVLRREERDGKYAYGVKFINVNKYYQVQLDEIIKAKISIGNSTKPILEDGIYAFLFIPRVRSRKLKIRI